MLRGKTGAARLALRSGKPFQPVAVHVAERHTRVMHGHFYGRPTLGVWQFGGTAYVAIGEAWHPFAQLDLEPEISEVQRVTDEIMERSRRWSTGAPHGRLMRIILMCQAYPPMVSGISVAVHHLAEGLVRRDMR